MTYSQFSLGISNKGMIDIVKIIATSVGVNPNNITGMRLDWNISEVPRVSFDLYVTDQQSEDLRKSKEEILRLLHEE